MFTTDTQLRQETADQTLKDIMIATLQDMFEDAAQVSYHLIPYHNVPYTYRDVPFRGDNN